MNQSKLQTPPQLADEVWRRSVPACADRPFIVVAVTLDQRAIPTAWTWEDGEWTRDTNMIPAFEGWARAERARADVAEARLTKAIADNADCVRSVVLERNEARRHLAEAETSEGELAVALVEHRVALRNYVRATADLARRVAIVAKGAGRVVRRLRAELDAKCRITRVDNAGTISVWSNGEDSHEHHYSPTSSLHHAEAQRDAAVARAEKAETKFAEAMATIERTWEAVGPTGLAVAELSEEVGKLRGRAEATSEALADSWDEQDYLLAIIHALVDDRRVRRGTMRAQLDMANGEYNASIDEIAEKERGARRKAEANAAALASELATAHTEAAGLRHQLAMVETSADRVWRWQGDGHDDPGTLVCPVVMSADRLRVFVAAERKATVLRAAVAAVVAEAERRRRDGSGLYIDWAHVEQLRNALGQPTTADAAGHCDVCGDPLRPGGCERYHRGAVCRNPKTLAEF